MLPKTAALWRVRPECLHGNCSYEVRADSNGEYLVGFVSRRVTGEVLDEPEQWERFSSLHCAVARAFESARDFDVSDHDERLLVAEHSPPQNAGIRADGERSPATPSLF
ncbi:MAG TPA: hypothetical protein VFR86_11675 [Burkholderiaceae bacterium]|nr:hypothetical protein [Burkholderiaceae bacterium]